MAVACSGASPGARRSTSCAHRSLRQPPERDELAAGADRLRQRPELVGDEDDDRVRRRLLEVLQQRVGRLRVQQVGAEDQVDAPVGLEGTHVQVAAQLAHLVDPDLVAERLEQVEVGVRAALDALAVAEQLAGEGARRQPLPDAGRTVEEVGVRRPVGERRAEQPLRLVLLERAPRSSQRSSSARPNRRRELRPAAAFRRAARPARGSAPPAPRTRARPRPGSPSPSRSIRSGSPSWRPAAVGSVERRARTCGRAAGPRARSG